MKKIIFTEFDENKENLTSHPVPSLKTIPKWFRSFNIRVDNQYKEKLPDGSANLTIKSCQPFLDTMLSGYSIILPCDVLVVDEKEYGYRIMWDVDYRIISEHSTKQVPEDMIPKDFLNTPFKWSNFWIIKTPPGYSCLFTHPLNRIDLPFQTLSGIVDTDNHTAEINFPFLLKNNFFGIIPKGTPIAQVFPFKRDEWKHEINKESVSRIKVHNDLRSTIEKSYKKRFWKRKAYK